MLEQIKTLDYKSLSEEEVSILIDELVALPDEQLTENLNDIIDSIDSSIINEESNSSSQDLANYVKIFNNERIRTIIDKMVESYPI